MTVKVFIEDMQVTLFSDEGISITSSVLDIEDITKNTTDYSKTFTVPANENNNYIFKHYYNADIDNLFDARVTVNGRIELDNFVFRTGKFVLRSVNVKKGVASSYTINFWGNLVSLKDILSDDQLGVLDLSALNHDYSSDNIEDGFKTNLFGGDIVYTLFAKKEYFYDSDPSDTTQTEESANIAYNGASGGNGVIWSDLKPSVKVIKIIEAIEAKYPDLQFTRDFFGTSAFTELYMWLNNDVERKIAPTEEQIDFDSGDTVNINLTTNLGSFSSYGVPSQQYYNINTIITPDAGYEDVEYTVTQYNNGEVASQRSGTGTIQLFNQVKSDSNNTGFSVSAEWTVAASQEFKFTVDCRQERYNVSGWTNTWNTYGSSQTVVPIFEPDKNFPEIKIIDFLRGLFQAFKLVIVPLRDGTIYVNTLTGYYLEGNLIDITRYVDYEKLTVSRGNILSEILYNFSDPQTIANVKFQENNVQAYGDEELVLKDQDDKLLQGDTTDINLPFEQILYDRLTDSASGSATNIQYAAIIDKELKPVNPKPHLHYVTNQSLGSKPIAFIDGAGYKNNINSSGNMMIHGSDDSAQPADVFLFSQEFSTWNTSKMNNTLYKNYHEPYISDIFNPKRRNYQLRAILPLRILLEITLNDVVRIGSHYYRFDNFTINTLTGEAQLKLVNSENISVDSFSANPTDIVLTKDAQTYSGQVSNLLPYTSEKIDVGFGTNWLTVSDDGVSNIEFTVTQNYGQQRIMQVKLIKNVTLEEILFTVTQSLDNIGSTVDSTVITVDNSQITI